MCKRILWAVAVVVLLSVGLQAQGPPPVRVSNLIDDPCLDPAQVQSLAINEGAASGSTQHVAISGSTRIYLCGGKLQGSAAGTVTVRFGTGAACATSPTDIDITSVVNPGDGGLLVSTGTMKLSTAGQALCTVRSASMTLIGSLRYVQK